MTRETVEMIGIRTQTTLKMCLTALTMSLGILANLGFARHSQAGEMVVPGPHAPTLADAIRLAAPGDRLVIKPGVYRERLIISKPLTLDAMPGAGSTVIVDGGGKGRVVDIQAADVTLRGLTLRNSGDDVEHVDACVYVHNVAHRAHLLDNTMSQCLFGIWVNGATDAVIARNTIRGLFKPMFSDRGNGINLWRVRNTRVERNVISEVRDGIYLSVSTHSRVADNVLHHLRFGIHYMYNDRNQIINNIACHNLVGLALMFSKQLDIRGNLAVSNRDHGMLFRTIVDSRVQQNRAEDNGKGFFLNDASFNEITQNDVRDNRIGVHVTAGSEGNRVSRNNFVNNAVQVRFSQRESISWGNQEQGNFWSDYLGWDMNRDGRGDSHYYSARRMDVLVHRYPLVKQLAASPVVQMLQALEARFPILRPAGVVDKHPSMHPMRFRTAASTRLRDDPQTATACGAPTAAKPGS